MSGVRRLERAAMEDTQMPEPLRRAIPQLIDEPVQNCQEA